MAEPISFERRERATRISVSGRGGNFRVQVGDEGPVTVSVHPGNARCECGRYWCAHIASLRACGFLATDSDHQELAKAA